MAPITICKGGVLEVGDEPPKEAERKPVLKLHLGRHRRQQLHLGPPHNRRRHRCSQLRHRIPTPSLQPCRLLLYLLPCHQVGELLYHRYADLVALAFVLLTRLAARRSIADRRHRTDRWLQVYRRFKADGCGVNEESLERRLIK